MFPNIASVVALAAVAIIFGIFGAATAREHPGRLPATVWAATGIAIALSLYALVFRHWPWIAGSLGVFSVVHLIVGLRQNVADEAPNNREGQDSVRRDG